MQPNRTYLLAITQDDFNTNGRFLSAYSIALSRLDERVWPVYQRTKNRLFLKEGNVLCFYVGGRGDNSGCVIGYASIRSISSPVIGIKKTTFVASPIESIINLTKIKKIEPLILKPILIRNGLIKAENKKWGAFLMGGFTKIPHSVGETLCTSKSNE